MKGKAVIPLVLGLVIGLLAVKFVIDTVRKAQASGQSRTTVSVVRAKEDIGAFLAIDAEMVEVIETNDSQLAPVGDRMEKREDVIGRVTAKAIPAKAPVLQSMLAPKGARPGMVARIPAGFRAVSVKIDEVTAAGYQIQPGDWVDVMVVMDVNTGGRKKETIAEVLLQRVQVAAIGQGTKTETTGGSNKVKPAKSATLLVREEDGPKLHLAATRGKLALAMRGEDDEKSEKNYRARSKELFEALGLVEPGETAKTDEVTEEPEGPVGNPHEVVVVRGAPGRAGTLERMTFEGPDSFKLLSVSKEAGSGESQSPIDQAIRRPPGAPSTAPVPPVGAVPGFEAPSETFEEPTDTVNTSEDQENAGPRE